MTDAGAHGYQGQTSAETRMTVRSPLRSLAVPLAAFVLFALACSEGPTGTPAALTALPRPLTAGESRVLDASNGFAFDLFRRAAAAAPDSNAFISPLSVSMALGMTLNGAAGTTLDSMRLALGLGTATLDEINRGYEGLIALLRGLDRTTTFRIANWIWYRQGFPFRQAFLDVTQEHFDARVSGLDFAAPSSVTTINAWIAQATAGKITEVIETIDPDDVMFLVNAIYFNGKWRSAFDRAQTVDATFQAASGAQSVRMMRQEWTPPHLSTALFDAVDLPYGNAAYAMTVLLPKPGLDVHALVDSLTPLRWSAWMQQFQERELDLRMPRFKLEYERTLNDDLSALGMRVAFDGAAANFHPMTTTAEQLYIKYVKHKTYVDVHEEGTEAAAVTVVGVGVVCACGPAPFHVDRPFVFVIRERLSGAILFTGKVVRIPS